MKNFVIATVSAVALLGANAYATEKPAETKKDTPVKVAKKQASFSKKKAKKRVARHAGQRPLAVYVNYPPVNVAAFNECPCEYYQDNKDSGYVWHEGYYWYPHANAEMLIGYAPHYMKGSYWYPSRLHPHAVYVDKKGVSHALYPVQEGAVKAAVVKKAKAKAHAKKVSKEAAKTKAS